MKENNFHFSNQDKVFLELTALDDDLPEHDEIFTVRLLAPDNSAKLGTLAEKNVIIVTNDSPTGLMQISVRHTTYVFCVPPENVRECLSFSFTLSNQHGCHI